MGVEVKADFSKWGELSGDVEAMIDRMQNLEPVLKGRAEALDAVIQEGFRTGTSPLGGPWKALSEGTIQNRRQGSGKPLVDTGQLKGHTNARATKKSVIFGVSGAPATYAGTHQFGRPQSKIPARRFLPMNDSGKADFSSGKALTWFNRAIKRVRHFILTGEL